MFHHSIISKRRKLLPKWQMDACHKHLDRPWCGLQYRSKTLPLHVIRYEMGPTKKIHFSQKIVSQFNLFLMTAQMFNYLFDINMELKAEPCLWLVRRCYVQEPAEMKVDYLLLFNVLHNETIQPNIEWNLFLAFTEVVGQAEVQHSSWAHTVIQLFHIAITSVHTTPKHPLSSEVWRNALQHLSEFQNIHYSHSIWRYPCKTSSHPTSNSRL